VLRPCRFRARGLLERPAGTVRGQRTMAGERSRAPVRTGLPDFCIYWHKCWLMIGCNSTIYDLMNWLLGAGYQPRAG
jgi:hypothetical protein